ncbi:MAG: hypothetical protein JW810_12250 [Sedimentisphaerales bacterium]|nr:hypothetical protein [Sedimentisphaerales bacterium]
MGKRECATFFWILGLVLHGATWKTHAASIEGWGWNLYGQIDEFEGSDYIAIAAGLSHSLGLRLDGSIVGKGNNSFGQLAVPPPNQGFAAIAAGWDYSLALRSDRSLAAWGFNGYGQCMVPAGKVYVAIAAGHFHGLAIKTDTSIIGWGNNSAGQLYVPFPNEDFIAVAAGYNHSIGLKSYGTIVSWGDNTNGQLNVPSPNRDFVAVAAGANHSMGLKSTGVVVCWGDNGAGQCDLPVEIPNEDFIAIEAGEQYSLGLKTDGTIVGWGSNDEGQIDTPNAPPYCFTAIEAGLYHGLALEGNSLYVDDDAPGDPGPGDSGLSDPDEDGTLAHPYDAIQEAIDAAQSADVITVRTGTYRGAGNRDLDPAGKAIILCSQEQHHGSIIDCEGSPAEPHRGFHFHGGETGYTTVKGFTIINGYHDTGGAIYCQASSPTIRNCTMLGNRAAQAGGGISCRNSHARLDNCTILNNTAVHYGGGIACAGGHPALSNCLLWDNTAGTAGAQLSLRPAIAPAELTVMNCDVAGGATLAHVATDCTLDWQAGNLDLDPLLTPDGHLWSESPCIDAGMTIPAWGYDRDGDSQPTGGGFEIGSDEFVDADHDCLPDWWEQRYFESPTIADPNGDPDDDTIVNRDEYELFGSDPNASPIYVDGQNVGDPLADGSWEHPFWRIQDGIDAAGPGDTVWVLPGTYAGAGNIDLDFQGKRLILRGADDPNLTIIDCDGEGRGFDFHSGETRAAAVIGFSIINGQADTGGAIRCINAHPQFRNCILHGNVASLAGGGFYGQLAIPLFAECIIKDNSPDGINMAGGGAQIVESLQLAANDWVASNVILYGDGTIQIQPDVTLAWEDTQIFCRLIGPGTTQVPLEAALIIDGDAHVNLNGGTLECNGFLQVKDNATISHTVIHTNRFRFENNAAITFNEIHTRMISPYGQYFVDHDATFVGNTIHAEGDRYIDLDPEVFGGALVDNLIYITIREGIGQARGGLLELRGVDYYCGQPPCEPNALPLEAVPPFDPNTWTIEELRLVAGAKVNLTNRFDYHPPFDSGGDYEVMYVKHLVLEPGSLCNLGFNRMYYQGLQGDPNRFRNQPLLGFSLITIALDDPEEFIIRVRHNNFANPADSQYDRIHVRRVVGEPPDTHGMMRMCNYIDSDPQSPTHQQLFHARAKGVFAQTSEPEILIRFEYLFEDADPGAELVIYLSDVPELLNQDDPKRPGHYRQVARLPAPPPGRPGSVGSGRFGVFEKVVSVGDLRFIRGTRMEFELIGPAGTCLVINNWDPYVSCPDYCMDVTGEDEVTIKDYLTVTNECGQLSSNNNKLNQTMGCLDSLFCQDGYINGNDLLVWDWLTYLAKEHELGSFCNFQVPLIPNTKSSGSLPRGNSFLTEFPPAAGIDKMRGDLLIAGKRFCDIGPRNDYASDRLYSFDARGRFLGEPDHLTRERANGRLIRDYAGSTFYQINLEKGLVRLSDEKVVVEPDTRTCRKADPWYGIRGASVHLGLHGQVDDWWGRPFLDAAFDPNGCLYILPVVVEPEGKSPYLAAAKLTLDPNEHMTYVVDRLYGESPLCNDNQDPNQLREIEVDYQGNVFILNNYHLNESDILWVYDNAGTLRSRCCLSHPDIGIPAPTALCVSQHDDSAVYLASSLNEPNANSVFVCVLPREELSELCSDQIRKIRIDGMGHVLGITEDPASGDLWVAGFSMSYILGTISTSAEPFYHPRLARIPHGAEGPIQAGALYNETTCDLRLPVSILWTQRRCGGADLDASRQVAAPDLELFLRHWLATPANPAWSDAMDLDGSGAVDLADLSVMAAHWLEERCR